uniref:Mucin-17-like n=2 Tax=Castor canadensis TaxID=51338 RepID=A0A8B7VC64_CASCN|nr:mucin-17-like [Castor canadensis]
MTTSSTSTVASTVSTTITPVRTTTVPTTTKGTCSNGGQWIGDGCVCPDAYTGERCQFLINVCQNGGLWDGLKCQCTSLYYGPRCEEVVDSIEIDQTVSAEVELTVTVTNQVYHDELQNRSSEEFKKFNETFSEQMKEIYSGISEYEGVNITELRPGSVVVKHDVLLKTHYTPAYKEIFKQAKQQVEEKIQNATKTQTSNSTNYCATLLCFNSTATAVQNITVTVNPEEECQSAGKEFAAYFTPEYKDGKLYCVTPCMSGFNTSLDCHYGKCRLQLSGPQCLCLTTDTHWYTGETCDWGVQKSLVYGLLGAVGAVLLVALIVVLLFLFFFKREVKRQKSRVTQLDKWNEEDGRPAPGTFQNTGFDVSEDREDYIHVDSVYSNFEASLSHINPETKIHIQRPQVITTAS